MQEVARLTCSSVYIDMESNVGLYIFLVTSTGPQNTPFDSWLLNFPPFPSSNVSRTGKEEP